MWKFEKNPEYISKAYTTNDPNRLARDVIIGGYEVKRHDLNFRPLYITTRGHSGSRCLSWIIANLHFYFGKIYNLSGDSYHTTPEIRRQQNVTDVLHDTIIKTCCKYLENGDYKLHPKELIDKYKREIILLKELFKEKFLQFYDPLMFSGWCWKDTDSYIIYPIFYEVVREYNPLVLHLVRDGRDIAFKTHRTDSALEAPGPLLIKIYGYDKKTPQYIRSSVSWAFQVEQFYKWRNIGDVFELKYEDLAGNPIDTMNKICHRIGIPKGLYDTKEIIKPIYNDRIRQFKGEDPMQVIKIEKLIGETLDLYGYY